MTLTSTGKPGPTPPERRASAHSLPGMAVSEAGALDVEQVLAALGSTRGGLSATEAGNRLSQVGPNAVRTHRAQPLKVLARQLQSPVLVLLAVTAFISFFLGQRVDTLVIGTILLASVGLGFLNEYRAERATEAALAGHAHRGRRTARRHGRGRRHHGRPR